MQTFISFFLTCLALLLAIPVAMLLIEIVAGIALPHRNSLCPPASGPRLRVAVLIPAHNESTGLLATLADIKAQLHPSDRLLVVADNCTDDTASVAAAAGAEVVDRTDPDRKGKGYALAWGVRHLSVDPPDVVIVIDADCRVADSAIERLANTCAFTHRPVQALYRMSAPDDSSINYRVAEFAWRVKNWARPLGLRAMGMPCQLMGTGMAFPWDVIRSADLASASIVEDLKLGLDLALAGNPPIFCPFPAVTSDFPLSAEGVQTQRVRWERGHLGTIFTAAPRLVLAAVAQANLDLFALALDLAVPPLSLLGTLVFGLFVVTSLAASFGASSASMVISAASLVGFLCGIFISWFGYGRDILPPRASLMVASYVIGKLPIYRQILSAKSGSKWIRTDRRKSRERI
jgi:cellulose synthase/poly-beta-1,6-N-acetylglucosamine synthase-like glycosyltransferase